MLELSYPPDCVVRHHGEGSIRVMVWGSLNANPQFLVRLYGSGKVLVVDQSDLRMAGNPGDERDEGGLQIPEDWAKPSRPAEPVDPRPPLSERVPLPYGRSPALTPRQFLHTPGYHHLRARVRRNSDDSVEEWVEEAQRKEGPWFPCAEAP